MTGLNGGNVAKWSLGSSFSSGGLGGVRAAVGMGIRPRLNADLRVREPDRDGEPQLRKRTLGMLCGVGAGIPDNLDNLSKIGCPTRI